MKKTISAAILIFLFIKPLCSNENFLTPEHIMFNSGLRYEYAVKQGSSIEETSSVEVYKSIMEYKTGSRNSGEMYIPLKRSETIVKDGNKRSYISGFLKKSDGIYFYIKNYQKPMKFIMYNASFWQDNAKIKHSKGTFYISGKVIGVRAVKVPYSPVRLKAIKIEISTKVAFTGYSLVDKSYYYFVKNLGLVIQERKGIIYLLLKTSLGRGKGERAGASLIANLSGVDAGLYLLGQKRYKAIKAFYDAKYIKNPGNVFINVQKELIRKISSRQGNIKKLVPVGVVKYPPARVVVTNIGLIELVYSKKNNADILSLKKSRFGINFSQRHYKVNLKLAFVSGHAKPAFYKNMLFISDIRGRLYCINVLNGKKMWSNILPARCSKVYISGGFLFFSTTYPDNAIYCLNVEGHIIWRSSLHIKRDKRHRKADYGLSMPGDIFSYKKVIALQSAGGDIFGILKSNGRIIWNYKVSFKNTLPAFYINGNRGGYVKNGVLYFYDLGKTITGIELISGKTVLKRKLNLKRKYNNAIFTAEGFVILSNCGDLFFRIERQFSLALVHLSSGAVLNETPEGYLNNSYAYKMKYYKGRLFVHFREFGREKSRWNYLSVISLPNFKALHNFKHLSIQKGISDYLARDYNVSFDFFRNYVLFAPEGYFYMLYMK